MKHLENIRIEQTKDVHGTVHRIDGFVRGELQYVFFINIRDNQVSCLRAPISKTDETKICFDQCRLRIFQIVNPEAAYIG